MEQHNWRWNKITIVTCKCYLIIASEHLIKHMAIKSNIGADVSILWIVLIFVVPFNDKFMKFHQKENGDHASCVQVSF